MSQYTLERLIERFHSDVAGKWHKEGRVGNDGSAGNTLEDILGVEENNLKLPDWGSIELKTKKRESQSLVTLLHREPKPEASVPKLLLSLGWRHQKAGAEYPAEEMSFRSTTRANSFSPRGFAIELKNNRVTFVFDPSRVNRLAKDQTGQYLTYGDWLDDVVGRKPNYTDVLPVYWDKDYILEEIKNKLDHTLFCLAKSKKINGVKHFMYDSATLFSGFNPSKIDELFLEKALYVDFDARTGHNHGTKFRVDIKHINRLFDKSVELI